MHNVTHYIVMDESELFSSPSKAEHEEQQPRTPTNQNAPFDAEEAREAALQKELEGVRKINEAIEGVIETLERAKGNMNVRALDVCSQEHEDSETNSHIHRLYQIR